VEFWNRHPEKFEQDVIEREKRVQDAFTRLEIEENQGGADAFAAVVISIFPPLSYLFRLLRSLFRIFLIFSLFSFGFVFGLLCPVLL